MSEPGSPSWDPFASPGASPRARRGTAAAAQPSTALPNGSAEPEGLDPTASLGPDLPALDPDLDAPHPPSTTPATLPAMTTPGAPSASSGPRASEGGEKDDRYVPAWNGALATWREFQRRVSVWLESTAVKDERRAAKLISRLSGDAWAATESLDLTTLRGPDGVQQLLSHRALSDSDDLKLTSSGPDDLEATLRAPESKQAHHKRGDRCWTIGHQRLLRDSGPCLATAGRFYHGALRIVAGGWAAHARCLKGAKVSRYWPGFAI